MGHLATRVNSWVSVLADAGLLESQREHELAIARLVTRIELDHPGALGYSERECRTLERNGAKRCSVDVFASGRGRCRRWPDLAVEFDGARTAIEIAPP